MRVLVTGATGRVGANMVKRLAETGASVRAMIMPGDPQAPKLSQLAGVELVEANLCEQAEVDVACRGVTHVIHLAAQLVRGDTPVDRFYDINALGTLRLLEGVVHAGGVERFVLASTDGTYRPGAPPEVPLSENSPQSPADYYGTSKLLGEFILRNHADQFDIPYAVVRFATVVSPEESVDRFRLHSMRALLRRADLGKDSNIWPLFQGQRNLAEILEAATRHANDEAAVGFVGPDGAPWSQHMVDVRDAVDGVYLALTERKALGKAFHIAAAAPTSHVDGATVISEHFNVPKLMVEMPITWRLELSIDAARTDLGFTPRFDFRDMVETAKAGTGEFIPARLR